MKDPHFLACLAVPALLAATAACGDPDCSVTKTCNVGDTTSSAGGSTSGTGGMTSTSSAGGAGGASTSTGAGGSGGPPGQSGDVLFQARYGAAGDDHVVDVHSTSTGSLVLAGDFTTSVDFGGGALLGQGATDIFLAQLSPAGAQQWASRFGSSSNDTLCSMSVDSADGIYLYGSYDGAMDIGLGALPGGGQFLARFVNGAAIWDLDVEPFGPVRPYCRAAASQANTVTLSSAFETQWSVGTSTISGNGQSVYPAGLATVSGGNPTGTSLLRKITGSGGAWQVRPRSIAADPAGNLALLVDGATQYFPPQQGAPLDLMYDGTTIGGTNGMAVLFRIASNGSLSWYVDYGSASVEHVSTYANGDVLVCGSYSGTGAIAAGFSLPTSEGRDVWIARYAAIGTLSWVRRVGGSGTDGISVLCEPTSDGNVVLAFSSDGPIDVGGLQDTRSTSSVAVAELDDDGSGVWLNRSSGEGRVDGLATAPDTASVALGFEGTTGFDLDETSVGTGDDILLVRFRR